MKETDIRKSNMIYTATMTWKTIVLLQLEFMTMTQQSITGVTYRDNFDFEERYRNLHECDPFYYHPLHLPEECTELFEKLIRSRIAIAANSPVRLVKKKEKQMMEDVYSLSPNFHGYLESAFGYPNYLPYTEDMYDTEDIYRPRYYGYNEEGMDSGNIYAQIEDERTRYRSPVAKMIKFLKKDVSNNPTAPVLGMSNFGPVAMYEQPISRQSENLINTIARAYAEAGRKNHHDNDGYYYGKIEVPSDSKTSDNNGHKFVYNEGINQHGIILKKLKNKKKPTNAKRKSKKHRSTKGLEIE